MTIESTTSKLPLPIILLNYVPVIYLGGLAFMLCVCGKSSGWIIGLTLIWIYLLPPLVCRLVLMSWGAPGNGAIIHSGDFRKWWLLSQLQTFFNRFPALEEMLRLFPACYSLWLCLWGSRVSPLVLWSPGVRVTDRYLLQIESHASLGWGSQLSPHLVTRNEQGEPQLILGKIVIGRGAIIGGKATLGPGSEVGPEESFPATRILGPFHTFLNGRRRSPGDAKPDSQIVDSTQHDHETP